MKSWINLIIRLLPTPISVIQKIKFKRNIKHLPSNTEMVILPTDPEPLCKSCKRKECGSNGVGKALKCIYFIAMLLLLSCDNATGVVERVEITLVTGINDSKYFYAKNAEGVIYNRLQLMFGKSYVCGIVKGDTAVVQAMLWQRKWVANRDTVLIFD